MKDNLGDRMKMYEKNFSYTFDDNKYLYCRLDGRSFSKITKKFEKPFDETFNSIMNFIALNILNEFNADVIYTQSDEISIGFKPIENELSERIFNNKFQKLISTISSFASSNLIYSLSILQSPYYDQILKFPHFDCRFVEFDDIHEITNMFYWRFLDCKRNAVQSIGQSIFSHKELYKVNIRELEEKIFSYYKVNSLNEVYSNKNLYGSLNFYKHIDLQKISHNERINLLWNK